MTEWVSLPEQRWVSLPERYSHHAIIDVGDAGYGVHLPLSTFTRLYDAIGEITLLVHTHVTQDAIELFGFSTYVEKQLFALLITVSGVGPKLAINILSGIAPEELIAAIERKDEARPAPGSIEGCRRAGYTHAG